jgi:hypothetical protein
LQRAIAEIVVADAVRRFLLVVLAVAAERLSLRDLRIPVPVRRKNWKAHFSSLTSADVWRVFQAAGCAIAARLATVPAATGLTTVIEGTDAAAAPTVFDARVASRLERPQLIITSPPYGAAQKYIRSCSLALGWTGLASASDLAALERGLTGREHLRRDELLDLDVPCQQIATEIRQIAERDQFRAAVYAHYFRGMGAALAELASLLPKDGLLVMIAGTNVVAGKNLDTHRHLQRLATQHGLTPILELRDAIRGRTLLTKRARRHEPLAAEAVHVFRKP